SAWAWRKGRAKSCAALADEFAAIFPFETKVYEDAGANISFVGNPLVDKVRPSMSDEEAKAYFGIKADEYPVLLMPGSRRQEIELLFPAMLEAAKRIKEVKKDTVFYLPVAQSMAQEDMEKMAEKAGVDIRFTHDHTYDLMAQAEFSLATSGTVVLEAALMGLPCIVLYRLSPVSYFFGKLLVHVRFFSLPNILLGEEIQPELLQDEVNPERILKEARRFWEESSYAEGVRKKLREACDRLGPPNAAKRVAERILAAAVRLGADKQTFGGSV
ncbi:MAG: lipid-A-disaccharide synthase, partial [Schwartzia sp.]|nr:lipid-A-disaccharide synthase [Schwartzia sp. (in: firmicutes)]